LTLMLVEVAIQPRAKVETPPRAHLTFRRRFCGDITGSLASRKTPRNRAQQRSAQTGVAVCAHSDQVVIAFCCNLQDRWCGKSVAMQERGNANVPLAPIRPPVLAGLDSEPEDV